MITVKEEFLSSVKTQRAIKLGGYSVLAVWLALKAYVAAGNTGGFIPAESIPDLPGMPKKWQKAMDALVDCGKLRPDGSRGPGLVERVELGFQLHDYEDHGTPVEVEDERRRKAREKKRRHRQNVAARGGHAGDDGEDGTGGHEGGQNEGTAGGHEGGHRPGDGPRAGADARPAQARAPARSQPSPAQPSPSEIRSETVSAAAPTRVRAREAGQQQQELIPCPADLQLTPAQRGTLETSLIPGWAIDALTTKFVSKSVADLDDLRSLTGWRKSLATAVSGDWNNPAKRPSPPAPDDGDVRGSNADEFERKRREAYGDAESHHAAD